MEQSPEEEQQGLSVMVQTTEGKAWPQETTEGTKKAEEKGDSQGGPQMQTAKVRSWSL